MAEPSGVAITASGEPEELRYTLYEVRAAPPVEDGALHESWTFEKPATAVLSVGALGTASGVTERSSENPPSPTAFTAVTL